MTFAPGKVGQAFSLNGTTGYIAVSPSALLTPLNGVSVEAWIDPTTLPSPNSSTGGWDVFNEFFDPLSGPNGPGAYALRLLFNGALQFIVGTSDTSQGKYWTVTTAPGLVTPGTFTHVAGTYDSTTGKLSVYVNGVATTITAGGTLNQDQHVLKIGADLYNSTYFQGLIDEPTVYGRALSPAEIASIYALANQGKPVSLGNCLGVLIENGATLNTIGGAAGGNVISGNAAAGIQIDGGSTSSNLIQANMVGVNAAGTAVLSNGGIGVWLSNSPTQNTIGGTSIGSGNVISGNLGGGVDIDGNVQVSNNVLQSNFIGTNFNGTTILGSDGLALGNLNFGVLVQGSGNDLIGGLISGAGNIISGNLGVGLILDGSTGPTSNIIVHSNFIGTNASGANLGNTGDGVLIEHGAINNTIGNGATASIVTGVGNIIAFNTLAGVAVVDAASIGNSIRGNSIFANGGLGIDDGFQGIASLIAAAEDPTTTEVKGTFIGTPESIYILDFYDSGSTADPSGHEQGKIYFATSMSIVTDASGNATIDFNLPSTSGVGDFLTVTATGVDKNTADFSVAVQVIPLPTVSVSGLGLAVRGQLLTYTITPSRGCSRPSREIPGSTTQSTSATALPIRPFDHPRQAWRPTATNTS